MSALLDTGLDVTALHNHFFSTSRGSSTCTCTARARPRSSPQDQAGDRADRRGSASGPRAAKAGGRASGGRRSTAGAGEDRRAPGRAERRGLQDHDRAARHRPARPGATINARMGLNTWAAFTGTDTDAVVAGDVAMLEHEVTPVLRRCARRHRRRGHPPPHDGTTGRDLLHYYGGGPAPKLARGTRRLSTSSGNRLRSH